MDVSYSVEYTHERDVKCEEGASNNDGDENKATTCRDEDQEMFPSLSLEIDDEDDDDDFDIGNYSDDENSDNNDNEKDGEDLLLALGAGCSEDRNDSPNPPNDANACRSKSNQKSREANTGLLGGLDLLNINSELSKIVGLGSSENSSASSNESTCLFLNNIYQTLLMENLSKVQQKLAENQLKQKVLVERIQQNNRNDQLKPRKNVFCIPYFHRKGKEPKPNAHTKILRTWHTDRIQRQKPWTNKDHENLVEAVHENVWEMTLKPFLQRLEIYSVKLLELEDEEEKKVYQQKIEDTELEMTCAQQKDMLELLRGIDQTKIDWMKISNLTFNSRHSDFSCYLMWKNWLHPGLNKTPWSQKETKKLAELVELHGRHQWKLIAEELETNRTPFHCLQHYRRKLDTQMKRDWNEEEDKILKEVIDTCRVGQHIPWNQVSFYMEGRSADQCNKRWFYMNPDVKRGKWSTEEDALLLAGVNMIGTSNWARIKQLVPGRNTMQCRERWVNCLDPNINTGFFSYDEDKVLMKLAKEHGSNWAIIAGNLPGRTGHACRRQYDKLKKWQAEKEYVSKQTEESKSFFINDFDVRRYANLVEAGKITVDELFPIVPHRNVLKDMIENRPQRLKQDLVRQELDRRKGEIHVPRPQILRNYSNQFLRKMWEHRKNLRKTIEDFIERQMIEKNQKSPKKFMKGYTKVASRLDQLKPSTSVTEMLEIARSINVNDKDTDKSQNARHLAADIDQKIRNLLYIDWLKEDLENKPKLVSNKSKASCDEEKFLDRLEGMTLIMTVLGMDRDKVRQKVSWDSRNVQNNTTSFMSPEEMQNLRMEYLLICENAQCSMNFSGKARPKVGFSDTIPPNTHTLNACRILFQERDRLKKSAEEYEESEKDSDEEFKPVPLSERLERVKVSHNYGMLRTHFRSVFMWPALLSTICPPKRPISYKPSTKKQKKRRYPMTVQIRKRSRLSSKSSGQSKNVQTPKSHEESRSLGIATTSTPLTSPDDKIPRRGRPKGALTKNKKMWDTDTPRVSSRQREKKARLDPKLSTSPQSETSDNEMLVKQTASPNKGPEAMEVKSEMSIKTEDLLSNVSHDLVQQVISQEVQVQRVGTYVGVPIKDENIHMPLLE